MRYEIKIPLHKKFKDEIINSLIFNKINKHYDTRQVNSVYFDTQQFSCAKDNMHGISNRKKYRARWYNQEFQNYFLEIKIKKITLVLKKDLKYFLMI